MDKIFELQEDGNISIEDRINMIQKVGEDIRKLIKTYTDIDTHKLDHDLNASINILKERLKINSART